MSISPSTISLLVKPAGPDCNLRCTYCFYRQKAGMFPGGKQHRMSDSTLERLITQALDAGCDIAMFSWQGGEPALMGLDFFRRVVELQAAHMHPGQAVSNALQTNATLLDRRWAEFLREHNFLVGVSLDGPQSLHNHYRRDEKRVGSHARVMQSLRMLVDMGAEVNILTLVNERNVREPDRVYDFLLETGVKYFQFVPCVEPGPGGKPASYSISPEDFGDFLCRLFDRWMDSPMDVSIRDFDDLLAMHQGRSPTTCIYQPRCGGYLLIEHNGDVFPCDFFVLPKWRLGNLNETPLAELRASGKLAEFGGQKAMLSDECLNCPWVNFCYGGCLKYRTVLGGPVSQPTYLCEAYKRLFGHASSVLAELIGSPQRHS
ncbi:MAG TPA: anaerobic sulfatase maturase [Armatimonadota bacterium]|nr:anaerobic sulfatase maturase [Armatimonadota bacterium]